VTSCLAEHRRRFGQNPLDDRPDAGAWWPDGHTIGYEHTFTHEIRYLLHAIAEGRDPAPSFAEGLQVQEVLDAVQRSAASGAGWTQVGR
jgi:predicted dehydrogenase